MPDKGDRPPSTPSVATTSSSGTIPSSATNSAKKSSPGCDLENLPNMPHRLLPKTPAEETKIWSVEAETKDEDAAADEREEVEHTDIKSTINR